MSISNTILIGSAAFNHLYPGVTKRTPKDMDLLVFLDPEEYNLKLNKISGLMDLHIRPIDHRRIDLFFVRKESPYYMMFKILDVKWVNTDSFFSENIWAYETGSYVSVPTLDVLYTLKMAHRFRKSYPHFRKTIYDIKLMRSLGAKIVDENWYKELEKWNYNYQLPKLKGVSKDKFFDGGGKVTYVYEHDDIHEAVKIGSVPAYTLYKIGGAEVECDKKLFDALPYETRLNGVMEEAMVLALERSLIPYKDSYLEPNPKNAYAKALEKVCTSITSGWFREFAWENYFQALTSYPKDFYSKFKKAVDTGSIRKLT